MFSILFLRKIMFFFLVLILWQTSPAQEGQVEILETYREQIKSLDSNPQIKSAFELIKAYEFFTRTNHIELTEVPAPPFGEENRAELFYKLIKDYGIDSLWIDELGNVLGLLKGTVGSRLVCLDAHLDTVFPEGTDVKVHERGDTLFAPGIGDDTRGLAMVITIARTLSELEIELEDDVLFVASVGEEGLGDLRGVKHLFRAGHGIDSWISIDGGSLGRVNNKALGSSPSIVFRSNQLWRLTCVLCSPSDWILWSNS